MQASHARQLTHYKNLLIRAQSASSSSLHDALTRLHQSEGEYARLEAEYAKCWEADLARESDSQFAGHIGRGSLAEAVKGLSKSERVRLLGVMAEGTLPFQRRHCGSCLACDPSDIDAQIAALMRYKRSRFDILGRLGPELAVAVMANLQLDDVLNLRLVRPLCKSSLYQVSRRHRTLSQENELWAHLCQRYRPASCLQDQSNMSSPVQEGHWEAEYRRLVRRDRNWRLGLVILPPVLASLIYLTSKGPRSHTLPRSQGSCDITKTGWDYPNKRFHRRQVSDENDARLTSVSASGMHPSGPLRQL